MVEKGRMMKNIYLLAGMVPLITAKFDF